CHHGCLSVVSGPRQGDGMGRHAGNRYAGRRRRRHRPVHSCVWSRPCPRHPVAGHLSIHRDRNGLLLDAVASRKSRSVIGRRWVSAGVAAVWSMAAGLASAATLQISPVSIELGPDEPGAAVTLRNPGSTPMFGQLRVYAWDQQDGQDVLAPTQSLAASPPLLQVPPGSEQLVRIVRTGAAEAGKESAYRILIDEIR